MAVKRSASIVISKSMADAQAGQGASVDWLLALLGRADRSASDDHSGPTEMVSTVTLRLAGETTPPQELLNSQESGGGLLCADPIALIADRDQLRLIPASQFPITQAEADGLIEAANRHFIDDGLRFWSTTPNRWYLTRSTPFDIHSRSPVDVAGASLRQQMPTGEDSLWWRQCSAELEMLFFNHPINEARQLSGELPISGVWPWGGETTAVSSHWQVVLGDGVDAKGIAALSGAKHLPEERGVTGLLSELKEMALVMIDCLSSSEPQQDGPMTALIDQWIKPLHKALIDGELEQLDLGFENGASYRISRNHRWRFWRSPLSSFWE